MRSVRSAACNVYGSRLGILHSFPQIVREICGVDLGLKADVDRVLEWKCTSTRAVTLHAPLAVWTRSGK